MKFEGKELVVAVSDDDPFENWTRGAASRITVSDIVQRLSYRHAIPRRMFDTHIVPVESGALNLQIAEDKVLSVESA